MKKTVVVYASKYGSTKRYAEWIAEELKADLFECSKIKSSSLAEYDTIIYGGGIYASSIRGVSMIADSYDKISDKNLVVFACGLAEAGADANINDISKGMERIFNAEQMKKIKLFYLRGAIDYSKLNFIHKLMMAMFIKILKKKEADSLTDDVKIIIDTYGKKADYVNQKFIEPIISYVKSL